MVEIYGLPESMTDGMLQVLDRYAKHEKRSIDCKVTVKQFIDEEHLHNLWYGGEVAEIECKGSTYYLVAVGETQVRLREFYPNGKIIKGIRSEEKGVFYKKMSKYIKNDTELYKMLDLPKDNLSLETYYEPHFEFLTDKEDEDSWLDRRFYLNNYSVMTNGDNSQMLDVSLIHCIIIADRYANNTKGISWDEFRAMYNLIETEKVCDNKGIEFLTTLKQVVRDSVKLRADYVNQMMCAVYWLYLEDKKNYPYEVCRDFYKWLVDEWAEEIVYHTFWDREEDIKNGEYRYTVMNTVKNDMMKCNKNPFAKFFYKALKDAGLFEWYEETKAKGHRFTKYNPTFHYTY